MQQLTFHTVDVFTTSPFSGNPLAIVLKADGLSDQQMQLMATEFNLPETLFVQSPSDTDNTAKVRIFTPVNEIPFAGHPTIGCAIFLAEQQHVNGKDDIVDFSCEIRLEEMAGLVPVQVKREQGAISAQLSAPIIPMLTGKSDEQNTTTFDTVTAAAALSLIAADIASGNSQPRAHSGGPTFLFVQLASRTALSNAQVSEPLCTKLSHAYAATGLYVYCINENGKQIDARMFAPAAGIPEDPATGSATAILASQLYMDGLLVDGTNHFTLRQGVDMNRPSDLLLEIELVDKKIASVKVAGSSVAISSGIIRVPS